MKYQKAKFFKNIPSSRNSVKFFMTEKKNIYGTNVEFIIKLRISESVNSKHFKWQQRPKWMVQEDKNS